MLRISALFAVFFTNSGNLLQITCPPDTMCTSSTEEGKTVNNQDLTKQIEQLEAKRLRNEVRRLKLVERAERANLRKLEAAERAKRTGRINIEALREQITHGLLKDKRGANSSALSQKSYAWRRLLTMLRQPADSPARLEAEGL